jgi:hypothetical protein
MSTQPTFRSKKLKYPTKTSISIRYTASHEKTLRAINALVQAGQRLRDLGYTLDCPPKSNPDANVDQSS